jgi:demethylmenaquinone methyltransferase / 2-methoxy-6-polyprenyl-1,4-benzoquinol methylase
MAQEIIKPYNEAGAKKSQVSTMFNRIAPYYDFLNRLLSLGIDHSWRRKAIRELAKSKPQYILDVATGTADVAIAMARTLHPAQIIGIDIAPEMLQIGRQKIEKQGLNSQIELQEGDSEALPFPTDSFDAVTAAFGVRNFENLEKGLQEMYRVLKPAGKMVILEFSQPKIFPFKQIFNAYFKYLLPIIGRLTSKDPRAYQYLYESVQAFPEGQDFIGILEKTGFKSNQCTPLTLGVCSIYVSYK